MAIKKKKTIIVLSVFISISISFIGGYLISSSRYHFVDVPVANEILISRDIIKNKDIKIIKLPKEYIGDNVVLDEEQLIGKYVSLNTIINENSVIYNNQIEDIDNMNDYALLNIKDNEVIYDLYTNDVSVNTAYLNNNMYIDLYLTIERPEIVSDLLIGSVKVCGLYDNNNLDFNIKENKNINIISIVIDKDMVPLLNKALKLGTISLTPCSDPYSVKDKYLNREGVLMQYIN